MAERRNPNPPARPRWQANAGTERSSRLPEALRDSRFGPDERSLAALASATARFARQLAFFNLRNEPDGTWERWFATDEALVLSGIADADVEALRGSLFETVDLATDESVLLRILAGAHRIDRWYRLLAVIDRPGAQLLCAELRRAIEQKLAPGLRWAMAHVDANPAAARLRRELDEVWGDVTVGNGGEDYSWDRARARSVFFGFLDAIAHLRTAAAARLEESLGSGGHEPSAALFLTFLKLYGRVQARFNQFTERHRDFYHRDCLFFEERGAQPDHVHLVYRRATAPGLDVRVPAGSGFAIGKELEGGPVVYRTGAELAVTPARVVGLRTIRLERDRLISPERELRYVTRVRSETIETFPASDDAQRTARYWPLFGGLVRRPGATASPDATLGFAIASPLLALAEGAREIRMRLVFDQPAQRDSRAADLAAELALVGHREPNDEVITANDVIAGVFERFARLEEHSDSRIADMAAGAVARLGVKLIIRDLKALGGGERAALMERFERSDHNAVVRAPAPLSRDVWAMLATALKDLAGRTLHLRYEPSGTLPAGVALLVDGQPALTYGPAGPWRGADLPMLFNAYCLERCLQARSESAFFQAFGDVFRRWMLLDAEAVGDWDFRGIKRALRALSRPDNVLRVRGRRIADTGGNPARHNILSCVRGRRRPARELLVNRVLADVFEVEVTTPQGWSAPTDTFLLGSDPAGASDLTLVARLRPDAAPVSSYDESVHRCGWTTDQPCVRVRVRAESGVFSYSVFADLALAKVHLDVHVEGARTALLHNQLGRLDPSKPFQPFGPLPARGSYLVFGSEELARKNVTALALTFEWGGLPEDDGGFGAYYRGYTTERTNQSVRVATSILRDGHWQGGSEDGAGEPLFGRSGDDQPLAPASTIRVDSAALSNHCRPLRFKDGETFEFDLSARAGFFKLTLSEPSDPFGNREYPQLLAQAVAANAKRKRPLPLPNAPYAPVVERLSFEYRAATVLNLAVEIPAERADADSQVLLLHPFGFEEIYPAIRGRSKGLVPRFEHDGNLLIALSPDSPPGLLNLLFHLRDESARRAAGGGPRPKIAWSYLAGNRWHALPADRVLADTTQGFLTSGIVTLDLPEGIDRANTILPADSLWLRVGTDSGFDGFAGLYGVHAQAAVATRQHAGTVGASAPRAGSVAESLSSLAGIVEVTQVGDVFGGRPAEQRDEFSARIGERLRHKDRALTHWDFERIVLEQFPAVFKVKCFAGVRGIGGVPSSGGVVVVVVPAPPPGAVDQLRAPKLNAVELERIRDFLVERCSPFARLIVRNPVYERIQVRCAVRFHRGHQSGSSIQRLNNDISHRLTPWREEGLGARFDWVLRKEEVEGWIRDLDYVDSVGRVSLLQVSEDDEGRFGLGDSAGLLAEMAKGDSPGTLRPRSPWSIALPTRNHAITLFAETRYDEARPAGVADLEVGNTFVIGRSRGG